MTALSSADPLGQLLDVGERDVARGGVDRRAPPASLVDDLDRRDLVAVLLEVGAP